MITGDKGLLQSLVMDAYVTDEFDKITEKSMQKEERYVNLHYETKNTESRHAQERTNLLQKYEPQSTKY